MVPERARMTIDSVVAPSGEKRTPCTRAPSVMPVAAKKTLSPLTRSSVVRDAVEVVAGVERGRAFLVVRGDRGVPGWRRPGT